jgi:hypothetical protein
MDLCPATLDIFEEIEKGKEYHHESHPEPKPVLYSFVRWYPPSGTHIAAGRAKTALCGVSVPKARHISNPCFPRDICRACLAEYLRIAETKESEQE